jgi:ubiquinol-cytochrome c reductase cytochrome b subunit
MPHVHTSLLRSTEFRPIAKVFFWLLVGDFLILTYIGACPPEEPYVLIGRIASVFYFAYFLVFTPLIGLLENKLLKLEIPTDK